MKPCKAKLPDGKPCPNRVDEGQEYCPYHLASQAAETKKILVNAVTSFVSVVGLRLGWRRIAAGFSKAAKFVVSKKL